MHILQITSLRVPPSKAWVWTRCSYQRVLGLSVRCREVLSPVSANVTGPFLLPEGFISREQQLIMSADWSSSLICSLVVGGWRFSPYFPGTECNRHFRGT